MNAPTTTSTSAASLPRVTPSPNCRYPFNESDPDADARSICDGAYATSRTECPTGYTLACLRTISNSGSSFTSTGYALPANSNLPVTTMIATNYINVYCCPDTIPWGCEGALATSCGLLATSDTVFDMGATMEAYSATRMQVVRGYAITLSQAAVTSREVIERNVLLNSRMLEVVTQTTTVAEESTTVWCGRPSCADLANDIYATRVSLQTKTPETFVLLPPPNMGRLGTLGSLAVSGFIAVIVLAASLLVSWAMQYRKRTRRQDQAR
ncbi:hypothetical protein CSHISOI_10320 [Colletotrichum shisoi]|uniref:Uncharacterized protein n=1 Tax=Colletotrichum shisoi TaxID=2078593 RepID=A0A5Q4BDX3_9PEZI|nr:hypothetical protein CSHISOI_10320 [Colletotrichum shisoi]